MRKYLRLTRAHTAPLEMVPAMVAGAIVSGGLFTHETALAGLFGLLYHLAGYGHNSVSDWRNGYDKDDPYKSHHPLNTGQMDIETAERTVRMLLAAFLSLGILIAFPDFDAIMYLIMGGIAGFLYNFYGKESMFDTFSASLAHTTPFAVSYLGFGGDVHSMEFLFGIIFMFFWVMFQISISGEVLGMETDEENFLKILGAHLIHSAAVYGERYLAIGTRVHIYTFTLLAAPYILIMTVAVQFVPYWPFFMGVALFGASCIAGYEIVKEGPYKRSERMRLIAIREALVLNTFIFLMAPSASDTAVFSLVIGSFIWVMGMNRYVWGTVISPRV